MIKRTKGTLLIELSLMLCCSYILFLAVSNAVNNQGFVLKRMQENNDVLLIMDSIASKVKLDVESGLSLPDLDLKEYQGMLTNSNYKLMLRHEQRKDLTILIGVESITEKGRLERIYKREIKANDK